MDKDDVGHSSSFTVITGAVDDPRITETTPTHKKASHGASLAAEYEPGHAKAFAALCRIFSTQPWANPFLPVLGLKQIVAFSIQIFFSDHYRIFEYSLVHTRYCRVAVMFIICYNKELNDV